MTAFVVDTNVPVVANGRSAQADPDCVIACIDILSSIHTRGVVVLDEGMQILREYMDNLSMSGQPGAGDFFMKWVWSIQGDVTRCERVHLTLDHLDSRGFNDFPDDVDLAGFDPDDRKYVAVALASTKNPVVLNAVDTDWAQHYVALTRCGVTVRFLCPQHVCPGSGNRGRTRGAS